MKAHGLLERIGRAYCYRLSDKGAKTALMFILFHKRGCGPLANSLFHHRPKEGSKPPITRLNRRFSRFSTCSPHENSERSILRLAYVRN